MALSQGHSLATDAAAVSCTPGGLEAACLGSSRVGVDVSAGAVGRWLMVLVYWWLVAGDCVA